MSEKGCKVFFLKKKSFYSESFSDQMDCSFGIFVKILEKCPPESSAGYLECVPDKTGVFEKSFQKIPVVTWFSVLTPLSKTFGKIWSLFIRNQQTESKLCFFWKKNLLSQSVSLNTWHAVLTSLPFLFHQTPETFSLRAQIVEKVCFFWKSVIRKFPLDT